MSPSDEKHNKLSTLSQDVIAVSRKQPAAEPPRTQERRAIPSSQDVFHVPAAPAPQHAPAWRPSPAPAAPVASGASRAAWAAVVMAAAAIGIVLYLAGNIAGQPVAAGASLTADPQFGQLRAELQQANARVQKLEQQLGAADGARPLAVDSANLLQVGAALREVQNRLDSLANEQEKLLAQLAAIRAQAAAAGKDGKEALARTDQLNVRVTALANTRGTAPAAATGTGTEAQLKALSQKTDKLATDVRQLYRQLESR